METFRTLVREPATVPEQVDGIQQGDDILRLLPPELATLGITELEYEFYRRLVEKQLLTYRLHGEAWRESDRTAGSTPGCRRAAARTVYCLRRYFRLDGDLTSSAQKRSAWR